MAKGCCEKRQMTVPFVTKKFWLPPMMKIHIFCGYASAKDSCPYSAVVYRHINMIKEMMKFGSLPKGRLVINSQTGQMSSGPKNG